MNFIQPRSLQVLTPRQFGVSCGVQPALNTEVFLHRWDVFNCGELSWLDGKLACEGNTDFLQDPKQWYCSHLTECMSTLMYG